MMGFWMVSARGVVANDLAVGQRFYNTFFSNVRYDFSKRLD